MRRAPLPLLVVLGALAAPATAPAAAPVAVDVAPDGATLVATAPAKSRGAAHFSWRTIRAGWRKVPAQRVRSPRRRTRRFTVRLAGLRPRTLHRFRLVVGRRRAKEGRFVTLAAPRPVALAQPPSRSPEPPAPAPPPPPPEPPPSAPALVAPPGGYLNPLAPFDFPDPMVLREGGRYWAYGSLDGFQILRSTDMVGWERAGSALPGRPAWAVPTGDWHPWAPSVARTADGFVLFYVALSTLFGPATNCVGVATAASPAGPFTDRGPLADPDGEPIGCGDAAGYGNIDPAPFVDTDGSAYLYVSTDWACEEGEEECTLRPELSVIPLAADLLSATGPRQPLFRGLPDTWEQAPWGPVVENPWVVERDGTYHLLYSGGAFTGAYGMGHATAPSPTGPFTRTGRILGPTADVPSAGGGMLIEGPKGGDWLAYHGRGGTLEAPRTLRIDPVTWPPGGGRPAIGGPTAGPIAAGP